MQPGGSGAGKCCPPGVGGEAEVTRRLAEEQAAIRRDACSSKRHLKMMPIFIGFRQMLSEGGLW